MRSATPADLISARLIKTLATVFLVKRFEAAKPIDRVADVFVRSRAAATLAGKAPAEMPRPELPALPAPQPVPTVRCFAMQNIKWREGREERRCEKFGDCNLPLPLAEKARAASLVVDPQSDEAKRMRQYRQGRDPLSHECVSLEEAGAPGRHRNDLAAWHR